jgi:hypothetical protein
MRNTQPKARRYHQRVINKTGMKKALQILVIVWALFGFAGCETNNDRYDYSNQRVLFQVDYENHAWGFQHRGWMVDLCGNVYCFDKPDNWTFCDDKGFITDSAMNVNLNSTNGICGHVDVAELHSMAAMIGPASQGKISEPVTERYDSGATTYQAFVYDSIAHKYQRVVLRQAGDWSCENQSGAGRLLANWLDGLTFNTPLFE